MQPMMQCGCQASGYNRKTNKPSCVSHVGIDPGAEISVGWPDLTDRLAKCGCGSTQPSERALKGAIAFFFYKGPGSVFAEQSCQCGFNRRCHIDQPDMYEYMTDGRTVRNCNKFRAKGPQEFDTYYCGCRGWD